MPISSNQWAVVTGGSSGIGLEFCRQLAFLGWNIVMVSNQQELLEEHSTKIMNEFNVQVRYLYQDLSQIDAAENVANFCNDKNVVILVNNAGIFSLQQFEDIPPHKVELYIGVHIATFTRLCHIFTKRFLEQQHGYILNSASLAAYFNMPGISLYQATKSYVLSLSKTLWFETYKSGVSVTSIAPGGVNTSLYRLRNDLLKLGVAIGVLTSVEKLVSVALAGMFRRKRNIIPGILNIIFIPFIKALPTYVVLFIKKELKRYEWR